MYNCLRQMYGRRCDGSVSPWVFASAANTKIRGFLTDWSQLSLRQQALIPADHKAVSLLRWRDARWWEHHRGMPASLRPVRRCAGRPMEWESLLVQVHGTVWKKFTGDRGAWQTYQWPFVQEREWTLGFEHLVPRPLPNICNHRAAYFDILGIEGCDHFRNNHILLVGSEHRSGDLALRKSGARHDLLAQRLSQALFAITGIHGAPVSGDRACFSTLPPIDNCALALGKLAAGTGRNIFWSDPAVRLLPGQTCIGYWGGHWEQDGAALAYYAFIWDGLALAPTAWFYAASLIPSTCAEDASALALLGLMRAIFGSHDGVAGDDNGVNTW